MTENAIDLTLILPLVNEDSNQNIQSFFRKMPIRFEVFSMGQELSLPDIISKSSGRFIFTLDAKLDIPLAEILVALAHFQNLPEIEVILGNRYHAKTKENRLIKSVRVSFRKFVEKTFKIEIRDIFCNFRAFKRDAALKLLPQLELSLLQNVEISLRAKKLGLKLDWISVRHMPRPFRITDFVRQSLKTFFELVVLHLDLKKG